jgi:hypothetical protein
MTDKPEWRSLVAGAVDCDRHLPGNNWAALAIRGLLIVFVVLVFSLIPSLVKVRSVAGRGVDMAALEADEYDLESGIVGRANSVAAISQEEQTALLHRDEASEGRSREGGERRRVRLNVWNGVRQSTGLNGSPGQNGFLAFACFSLPQIIAVAVMEFWYYDSHPDSSCSWKLQVWPAVRSPLRSRFPLNIRN